MMHFSSLSPKALLRIMRGSVSFSQKPSTLKGGGWAYRVSYPNGYGASIVFSPAWDDEECWDVALLKDGELFIEDDGYDYTWSDQTEEDVIELCDYIYFK